MRRIARAVFDPRKVRLSEHFLLSDFMGCHSVYKAGYENPFVDTTGRKFEEGKYLCESLLERVLAEFGPISISYGYISPQLSRNIVRYQDPNKPSYHRWDDGAAADVCIHGPITESDIAPILTAHEIDCKFPYSRMITYSESPYLCLATRSEERNRQPRRAFYENRFEGITGVKPTFITMPKTVEGRWAKRREAEALLHHWKGSGYPTYHGGGRRQYHHIRVSEYRMLSDFLYDNNVVQYGGGLPFDPTNYMEVYERAGEVYDNLLIKLDVPFISIIEGVTVAEDDSIIFGICPPQSMDRRQVVDAAMSIDGVIAISGKGNNNWLHITLDPEGMP